MKTVQLHGLTFDLFLDQSTLQKQIQELALNVSKDYAGKCPIIISVLNGAFRFTSTFMDYYNGLCEVSFIRVKSYEGTSSTGKVKELLGLDRSIENRDIIIMEDIVDTGETIEFLWQELSALNPSSIQIATLFLKPEIYGKEIPINYIGQSIPNRFIVGFGLDYDELGRNLNAIYQKKE